MKKQLWFVLLALIFAGLACNLPILSGSTPEPGQPDTLVQPGQQQATPAPTQPSTGGASAPGGTADSPQVVVVTATPAPTSIPFEPVTIRQGLASLNSYRMVITIKNTGPDPADLNEMIFETSYDTETESMYLKQISRSASADDPEVYESLSETYQMGLVQCVVEEGEFEISNMSPAEKEMTDLMVEMVDMTPIITNPQFVRSEMYNGVMTNFFTFQVSGMGARSGAEVVANWGEYWLAVDGNYIMKYTLLLETRDEQTNLLHFDARIEMLEVNQPVNISLPAGCQP